MRYLILMPVTFFPSFFLFFPLQDDIEIFRCSFAPSAFVLKIQNLLAVRVKNLFYHLLRRARKFNIHGTNAFPPYRAVRFSMQCGLV